MKLSSYLDANKISQTAFGAIIGKSQAAVSKFCSDSPSISLETALLIERETKGAVPVEEWPQFKALKLRQMLTSGSVPKVSRLSNGNGNDPASSQGAA